MRRLSLLPLLFTTLLMSQSALADTDQDGDGISDALEAELETDPSDPSDRLSDSDGDGFSNLSEVILGTDPNDSSSTPELIDAEDFNETETIASKTFIRGDNAYIDTYETSISFYSPYSTEEPVERFFSQADLVVHPNVVSALTFEVVSVLIFESVYENQESLIDVFINDEPVSLSKIEFKSGRVLYTFAIPAGESIVSFSYPEQYGQQIYDRLELFNIHYSQDQDEDGFADTLDNCPLISNPEQLDYDSDTIGDLCDNDIDNDGLTNEQENTFGSDSYNSSDYIMDSDSDGIGNLVEVLLQSDPMSAASTPEATDNLDVKFGSNGQSFPMVSQGGVLRTNANDVDFFLTRNELTEDYYSTPSVNGQFVFATNFTETQIVNLLSVVETAPDTLAYTDLSIEGGAILSPGDPSVMAVSIAGGPRLVTVSFSYDLFDGTPPHLTIKRLVSGQDTEPSYGDNLIFPLDTCPMVRSDLTDSDGDGLQDECDYDEADSDEDGVPDGSDNCPTVYNPSQEALVPYFDFFGDACNPDDDFDSIPDAIEDQLEYRDSRGGDLTPWYDGSFMIQIDLDSDSDGANDLYEINTGTDPFTPDEFDTVSLVDYLPLGEATYTYRSIAATVTPEYLVEYTQTMSRLGEKYIDDTLAYFGEPLISYSIGKDGIRLDSFDNPYTGETEVIDMLHFPFEIREGGITSTVRPEGCRSEDDCVAHWLVMLDKGTMEFQGELHEYVTLASYRFTRNTYYIYLKDIGLYGTHYMNLVDYEITNRVDVAAIAAALPEPETPVEVEQQPTSESSSSGGGGGGGAVNLFWMLLTMVSLIYRRKYQSA